MNKIEKTTNYDLFIFLNCNRDPKKTEEHVLDLMRKIIKKNLLHNFPILVDGDFKIIDGQHRLLAAQRLGVPIYYLMDQGAGVEDIGSINSSQKPWNPADYIHHYAELGNQDYIRLKAFMEKHNVNHQTIIYNTSNDVRALKEGRYKFMEPEVEKRLVEALEKKNELVEAINTTSFLDAITKHTIFRSGAFMRSLISFICREDVDFKHFKKNFILLIDRFRKCASREAYHILFLEIYNYRLQYRIE